VAEGIAVGPAKIVELARFPSQVPRQRLPDGDIEREIKRFKTACAKARRGLEQLADRVGKQLGRREADMIRPQAMMAEDPTFLAEVEELIVERRVNAEAAVADVVERFEKIIESLEDRYLRERSTDVRDAGRRILGHLLFADGEIVPRLSAPSVVVSSHLLPSLTVHLDRERILAFATEKGGYTSHAAILARSLDIPAVTGLSGLTEGIVDGETVIVDGIEGLVVVGPGERQRGRYERLAASYRADRGRAVARVREPSQTRDGVPVRVQGNVGRAEDVQKAVEYGADGVGLYRTEFDYLSHSSLPSEEMLADEYGRAAEAFGEKGVVLRALDIGGDKFPPSIPLAHEENPFMGLRGLRLMLQHAADLMLPQLRAIVRASARGKVAVLYPMVVSVEDLEAAERLFERASREVRAAGHEAADNIEQGIMIEVPACIPMLPELLARCSFASVGTNDLVQYLLAADRNSERMVDAYDPFHPAVIRVLGTICRGASAAGVPISVCGETASDTSFLPLLLGLGYRTLSVNVRAVPYVREAVRGLCMAECERLAGEALKATSAAEVQRLVEELLSG